MVFEAKLRVMPACWFLLSKFYLRVDGVLTRCRETRLFHKFVEKNSNEEGEICFFVKEFIVLAETQLLKLL